MNIRNGGPPGLQRNPVGFSARRGQGVYPPRLTALELLIPFYFRVSQPRQVFKNRVDRSETWDAAALGQRLKVLEDSISVVGSSVEDLQNENFGQADVKKRFPILDIVKFDNAALYRCHLYIDHLYIKLAWPLLIVKSEKVS